MLDQTRQVNAQLEIKARERIETTRSTLRVLFVIPAY